MNRFSEMLVREAWDVNAGFRFWHRTLRRPNYANQC
jgi:hypothetical protein